MDKVEEAARQYGVNIEMIVNARKLFGIETDLLDDVAPLPTWTFTEKTDG